MSSLNFDFYCRVRKAIAYSSHYRCRQRCSAENQTSALLNFSLLTVDNILAHVFPVCNKGLQKLEDKKGCT